MVLFLFFSEKWGKMLKNRIFARISYEIFKISQKEFKIFAYFQFLGARPPPPPARQAWQWHSSALIMCLFLMVIPRTMIPAPGSRRILQERCWKLTGSCRKTPKMAGKWKQYSGRKLPNSCAFRQEATGNHWKKSGKFHTGILLAWNRRNVSEPAVSIPECSTWVVYGA